MKISIIVAVYNIEQYLEKCLQKLIKVGPDVTEIICIDDGSTDNSYSIIRRYEEIDQRIIPIHKDNGGISSTRNMGIKAASGDYLIFIDGDDYIEPSVFNDFINKYRKQLDANDSTTIWYGFVREDWNGKHGINPAVSNGYYEKDIILTQIIPSMIGISYQKLYQWFEGLNLQKNQEFPSVWRAIYSKKIIDDNNLLFTENIKMGEDLLFNWEYLAYAPDIYVCDTKYYHYVWRKGSLSQNSAEHFYTSRKALAINRERLNSRLSEIVRDFSDDYQGSLVLSKIQIALTLSDCPLRLVPNYYKMYLDYTKLEPILKAYEGLQLKKAPLKYKLPLYMAKNHWDILLFIGGFILSKLKIQIYPED